MISDEKLKLFFEWKNNTPNSTEILSDICKKCRNCCKEIGIHTQYMYDRTIIDFYEARGFKVDPYSNGLAFVHKKMSCPYLKEYGCEIYNERPAICREFNGLLHFYEKCDWQELFKTHIKE